MENSRFRKEQRKTKCTFMGKTLTRRTVVLLATMATGLVLASGVALANQVPCSGGGLPCGALERPENQPSESNDVFSGSADNDSMSGFGGDDEGYGHGGDDTMTGMEGNDSFDGGTGNDTFYGGPDDDFFLGAEGDDLSWGVVGYSGLGNDTLEGGEGNDRMAGGEGDDGLFGGEGVDHLKGYTGGDIMDGGAGNDVLGKGHELDDAKDPGQDSFYGGEGDDFILARDGEDDRFVDCGEGLEDVAEVDHGLIEWRDTVNCEIIWDGVGPSISAWGPTPSTNDRTPIIQANARDSHPRARIKKADIKMYVDGRQVSASYNPRRGLLTYTPTKNLALGGHTIEVEVVEEEGLKATKTWTFRVVASR